MLPVLAGGLLLVMAIASPAHSQTTSSDWVDMRSQLSQDMINLIISEYPSFTIADAEMIARNVQVVSGNSGIDSSLILALMAGEELYAGYPQARLYYFNLDLGSLAGDAVFPIAWFDIERVARAYGAEFERYENKASAIAAYYIGSRALPPDGDLSGQSDSLRELVSTVMTLDAEWSHLGEERGPQIITPDEETPGDAFIQIEYDMTEIENAYIQNMMYFNSGLTSELAHEIFDAIYTHASSYQTVDARLVMALVATESSFRPDAVSHCGAEGLGQLMPYTAENFGVSDSFDIDENIRATFAYLAREIERWNGQDYELDRILAAYNAGPGAVERYTNAPHYGIPPYEETVNYVRLVVNRYFYFLPEGEREALIGTRSRHYTDLLGLASAN